MNAPLSLFERPAAVPPVVTLRPYQERGIDGVRALYAAGRRNVLLVASTGCHRAGQAVLMFDGSTKRVEDIATGDLLMGPDSRAREVLHLCRGVGRMVRIVPRRGAPFVVNEDHVLTLVRTATERGGGGDIVDVTVREWLGWGVTAKHVHKLFRVGVDFPVSPDAPPLPLDPYFLGLLLGDGDITNGRVGVCKPDPEVRDECYRQAALRRMHVRADAANTTSVVWCLSGPPGAGVNPIVAILRALDLAGTTSHTKFVPPAYLVAARDDRLALLAGLLDSDGHLHNGGFDWISASPTLARGLAFVARSLGLSANVAPADKLDQNGHGGTATRIRISGDCSIIPTRIPRKQAAARRQKKDPLRTGFTVERLPEPESFYGFTLSGDGRYLLGDFLVTHNSGKTVMASAVIVGAVRKGKRVLFLAHRKELIDQCYSKLLAAGLSESHLGTILAGDPRRRPMAPVQVASVQSIAGRAKPPADLVVVDESQHANALSYRKILDAYPAAKVLGLTATPCRADGRGLGDVFEEMVLVATFRDLAADGFLVPPRVFTSRNPLDLSKLKTTGGDYDLADLDKAVNTRELVGDIVATWQARAEGRTTVVFASSVEHSRAIVAQFTEAGVAAEHLDGTTDKDERAAILARLASGETTVVSNMGVLTEGWDLPRCKCVVLARPTKSLGLYLQMAGRGLRPWENTSALLLDHAGCVLSHGFPQDDREWSLEAKKKRAAAPPVRTCPDCYAALPGGTAVCSECGHVFEADEREGLRQVDGELLEVVPPSETPIEERRAWYASVLESAARRGRKIGFARHRYREKFGGWPAFRVEERTYYPAPTAGSGTTAFHELAAAVDAELPRSTPAPQESGAIASDAPAQRSAPLRARRIDLASLLRTSAVPADEFTAATVEVDAWSL